MNFAHITEADIGLAKCGSVLSRRLWQGALRDDTKTSALETNAKWLVEIIWSSGIARVLQ